MSIDLTILVPVYNEQATLVKLLKKLDAISSDNIEVIIVNDGSKDASQEIIDTFLSKTKFKHVKSITHPRNKGKGAGIQTGIDNARGKYFVIQDADLEYEPKDIATLLKFAIENEVDSIYGSRFQGHIEGMAKANYYANKFYNFILRRMYPTEITDMHTCYKMVKTKILKEIKITSNGFGYAPELVSKLLKKGIKIYELPVSFKGRSRKDGKKIDVLDGVECVLSLMHYRYGKRAAILNLNNVRTVSKFMVVGVVGFIVNVLMLKILKNPLKPIVAEIIAVLISLQVTFALHDRWTYSHVGKYSNGIIIRYGTYISTNIMGGFMTAALYGLFHKSLGDMIALFLGAVLGLIWNFVFNVYVTWSAGRISKGS